MTSAPRNQYVQRIREAARNRSVREASADLAIQTFRGPAAPDDPHVEIEFLKRCLEHERAQLKKAAQWLRRAEAERDAAVQALERIQADR
jgi:hypothetical protein